MISNHSTLPPFEVANETSASWIPAQESYLIDLMVDVVTTRVESRISGSFSRNEWFDIRKRYYNRWGAKHDLKAFKNKMNTLKDRLKEFKKLVEGTESPGLVWDPVLGTVIAPDSWWDDYLKANPKAKRFRIQGCPEYEKLATIYGDKITFGHLQTSTNHDFDSVGGGNGANDDLHESAPSTLVLSTPMEGTSTDDQKRIVQDLQQTSSHTQSGSTRSGKKDTIASEISEMLHHIANASQFKAEMTKKYTISECIGILDAMGPDVGERTYMKAVKLLQEKGWREAFICMPDQRRKGWLRSIEAGDI